MTNAVVAPLLHTNDAPLVVRKSVPFAKAGSQAELAVDEIAAVGSIGLSETVIEEVFVQPFAAVTVTT